MRVSVVIPTYKRPALLQHCLRCLYLQASAEYPFEVIVVTDGPDRISVQAAASFMHIPYMPLRVLSLPAKKGPAAARNYGWKVAEGELIVFTDDDCLPACGFIAAYINAWHEHAEKDMAFTGKLIVPVSDAPTDYENNTAQLATAEFVTANCACTKNLLQSVGGFDEDFTMAYREDSELQFKLLDKHVPPIRVEGAVVIHPVRKARWGISLKEQKKSMFNALLLKKHPVHFRKRIYRGPLWNYYAMNISLPASLILLLCRQSVAGISVLIIWLILTLTFTYKRLKHTRKTPAHVLEMAVTSALIPFLSVYWTLYGAVRYKTLLL